MEIDRLLNTVASRLPQSLNLSNRDHHLRIERESSFLLDQAQTSLRCLRIKERLINFERSDILPLTLVVNRALSRAIVKELNKPVQVTWVVPVYKERKRLAANGAPLNGEDFVHWKHQQLKWLFLDTPVKWRIVFVDDYCPEHSGAFIEAFCKTEGLSNVKVIFQDSHKFNLQRMIQSNKTLQGKGAAVRAGLSYALTLCEDESHLIGYTDADLSNDLAQTGLLISHLINGEIGAFGNRYIKGSMIDPFGVSAVSPKDIDTFLYKRLLIIKILFPHLSSLTDIGIGLKLFKANAIASIISTLEENGFAFDIEIIARLFFNSSLAVAQLPIYWCDSPTESKSTGEEVKLQIMSGIGSVWSRLHSNDVCKNSKHVLLAQALKNKDTNLVEELIHI